MKKANYEVDAYDRTPAALFLSRSPQARRKRKRKKSRIFRQSRRKYLEYLESERWKEFRASIIRQRGYKCQMPGCGERKRIQLHHLTYKRLGHELPEDVSLLCRDCHKMVHGK